jgi:hypothetical protein
MISSDALDDMLSRSIMKFSDLSTSLLQTVQDPILTCSVSRVRFSRVDQYGLPRDNPQMRWDQYRRMD